MSTKQVLAELRRELAMRQDLYPMWVNSGRLTSKTAEHRIAAIQKAIEIIESSQRPQAQQFSLFGAHILDHLITASLWAGLAYLVVGFAAFTVQRGSNAVPLPPRFDAEGRDVTNLTGLWDESDVDPVTEALAQVEAAYRDVIVPFMRPVPQYSDLALIRMAKSIKYPGASKWSYSRKLSQSVRDELLQLAKQSA